MIAESDAVCPNDSSQNWTWHTEEYSELLLHGEKFLSSNPVGFRKCLNCGQLFWVSNRPPGNELPMAKMIMRDVA